MITEISVHVVILGRARSVFCGIYTCVKRVFTWGGRVGWGVALCAWFLLECTLLLQKSTNL